MSGDNVTLRSARACTPSQTTISSNLLLCSRLRLYKALSSEEPVERRKASACLSRLGRAVTSVQASEKERELDSNRLKQAVQPLLHFQPGGEVDAAGKEEKGKEVKGGSRVFSVVPCLDAIQTCTYCSRIWRHTVAHACGCDMCVQYLHTLGYTAYSKNKRDLFFVGKF